MMWYGAQHTHILDDRDVDEYYRNPQLEEFVHLKETTVKIIVYSTVETILFIDMANMWSATSWTLGEPQVFGYAVAVREGMNLICVYHTRDSEEWPEPDQRVTVELRGLGQICLHPT